MEDLFRFVALRAPEPADSSQAIDLTRLSSEYQGALAGIHRPPPNPPADLPSMTTVPSAAFGARVRALMLDRTARAVMSDEAIDQPAVSQPLPDPVQAALRITAAYTNGYYGGGFIWDSSKLPLAKSFAALYLSLSSKAQDFTLDELSKLIQSAFDRTPGQVASDEEFRKEKDNVADSIIAIFIHPLLHANPIGDLVQIARLMDLIERVAAQDQTLNAPGAVAAALTKTLLLPPAIFPLRPDLPKPVGVGDLLVVKQHIKRYELGEIEDIENILQGETRNKTNKHTFTLDRTSITETEKTTETTTELTTAERFELKTESENTVKEDINAHAALSVSAKYGAVEINANADVAYGLSKNQSTKAATDHAKDVTSRAVSKVTERVRQQVTSRTIEIFEENEEHGFDNKSGQKNISGVYQWVNKVYEAQVFNYGNRLLFDLMVPEPAAFLLDAVATNASKDVIKPPEPFVVVLNNPSDPTSWRPVRPDDLGPDGLLTPEKWKVSRPITPADLAMNSTDTNYYGLYVAKYGAAGVKALPELTTTVSKGYTGNKDDHDHLALADNLPIPTGYKASSIAVRGGFTLYENEDGDEAMWVFVGKHTFMARGNGNLTPKVALINPGNGATDELGNMPVAVETQQARDFSITVDVTCTRTDAAVEQWRIDTHSAIMNAYAKLYADYLDKRAAQTFQTAGETPLGGNPDQNRIIERTELKKGCIALLAGMDIYGANFNDIRVETVTDPVKDRLFPRPNVPPHALSNIAGADQGAFIRFFEQAFEWEHIMYLFYPYYWGRHKNWYDSAIRGNEDPLFAEFLKAGSARVVIPVRLQLEADVRYFLMTGQIWHGGGLPEITDTDYLPITEEIKARDNAPGDEKPQGDAWEVVLPTSLIKLRDDDTLPIWKKFVVEGHDVWVPGRMQQDKWVPDYGKLDANGNWTPP